MLLTSSNEDVPKGICSDKWAGKICDRSSKLDYIRYSEAALTPMSPYQDDDFSKAYTNALYRRAKTVYLDTSNGVWQKNPPIFYWCNRHRIRRGGLSTSRGIADGRSGN